MAEQTGGTHMNLLSIQGPGRGAERDPLSGAGCGSSAGAKRGARLAKAAFALAVGLAVPALLGAQGRVLTVDGAVAEALRNDPGVTSSTFDWLGSQASAEAARDKMLPSVTLSAGYMKLSELPSSAISAPSTGNAEEDAIVGSVASMLSGMFPDLTNSTTFKVGVQYPIFAGFRITEAANLAKLQAQGKGIGVEMVKRGLAFEVRRAYWETVRSGFGVQTLAKNLDLTRLYDKQVADRVAQGLATDADRLTADLRVSQAELSLADAVAGRTRANLVLATLIGDETSAASLSSSLDADGALPFSLSTEPEEVTMAESGTAIGPGNDPAELIPLALSRRPETRASSISVDAAERAAIVARGGLYPTVALVGDYVYADPNQRVLSATDKFTGTWDVGVQVSIDLGGIPGNLAQGRAGADQVGKAKSDAEKQMKTVVLDVRTCILNLERMRRDLELTKRMVPQATENLRVTRQKYDNGMVSDSDVLGAEVGLLQAEYAVTSTQIDVRIASADLDRSVAAEAIR
jgi:outer membrane protein